MARDVVPQDVMHDDAYGELEKCSSYFKDSTNPIWFGRVQGLTAENQNLFIYGYFKAKEGIPIKFDLEYTIKIRAGFEWQSVHESTETISVVCRPTGRGDVPCERFRVGFVPMIEYEMYDVAIHIKNAPAIPQKWLTQISFNIAYVNTEYTVAQIAMRIVYALIAFGVMLVV